MFPATDFRLKRLKKSPLPFQHQKVILQLDHNTSPKSASTTINSEITSTQSTSTNTPSTITATTTTANTATTTTTHTVSTSYNNITTNTTTTTNTSTQTDIPIPALMQLNIPIPSRIRTPSTSITIPLSSSISRSPIFPRTLQDLQQLGLWGATPPHPNNNQRRSPSPSVFEDTPHPRNARRCSLNTHTHKKNLFFKNSNKQRKYTQKITEM